MSLPFPYDRHWGDAEPQPEDVDHDLLSGDEILHALATHLRPEEVAPAFAQHTIEAPGSYYERS